MSIALLANGQPAPATFQVGVRTILSFEVDGEPAYPVLWTIQRRAGEPRNGVEKVIFEPESAEPYYLYVQAVAGDSLQEAVFTLDVTATGQSATRVTVAWSDPLPTTKNPFDARIICSTKPSSIGWRLLINNVPVLTGSGDLASVNVVQPCIVRLIATVIDAYGNTVEADSSLAVQAPFGLQSSITPPQPVGTLQLLGDVYSPPVVGQGVLATYLPYELMSLTHTVKLLPGTTHYLIDLDPVNNVVEDEVVVRTAHGNWTINGPPNGLTAEGLPYDYQHGLPYQPAALDLNATFTAEVWKVHGMTARPFNFRLRVRCYRDGAALYRYTPCDWSAYYGGEGQRQRRMLALITSVDAKLDAESPDDRLGSQAVETFTVPHQRLVLGQFTNTGSPDRPIYQEDHFFSDQNCVSRYEHVDGLLKDLLVSCSYGLPGIRPCYLDFSQAAKPRIIQKLKRLYGELVVYVAGGALTPGTVITVRIHTGKGPVTYTVPVSTAIYNPNYDQFDRVASIPIDLSDFEFERIGVLMDFTVDETNAASGTSTYDPLHQVGDDYFFTGINSPAIKVDTACYRDPQLVSVFEGTFAGSAVPLPDCNRLACGPVGIYCYTPFDRGGDTVNVAQPLGFPAPFIAYTDDQARCYHRPIFLYEVTAESAGSHAVYGYTGTTGCGIGYRYIACNHSGTLVVIFPTVATPHAVVSFSGTCWVFDGNGDDLRPYEVVTASDVTPVFSCADTECTGADPDGDSVLYLDQELNRPVSVQFHHLDYGIPACGVAPEHFSTGFSLTPPGKAKYTIWQESMLLFAQPEQATVKLDVTPNNIWRDVVIQRSGRRFHYKLPPGVQSTTLPLEASDQVFLEFGSYLNVYRGKSGEATWERIVEVPRVYDTAVMTFAGSQAITAIGFTGLTNRQDYTFYGTLPADVEMALPNPDSVVTVQDGVLPEMILVRAQAVNENRFIFNKPSYAGQRLSSPVTFRFYANRSRAGQHGEMDVWLENDYIFPPYLKVSPYKVLAYGDYSYRKTAQFGDTTRRSLRVVSSPDTAETLRLPRIYADDRGERISARASDEYVFYKDQPYVFNGTLDSGISEIVHHGLQELGPPEVVRTFNVTGSPRGLAYIPDTDEIWAATTSGIAIVKADATPGVTMLSIGPCRAVAWCAASSQVIVASLDGTIRAYHPGPRTLAGTGNIGSTSGLAIFLLVRGSLIYAATNGPTNATIFALTTDLALANTYSTGSPVLVEGFVHLTFNDHFLLGTESGGSWLFNPATGVFTNLGLASTTALGFCEAADRQTFYVASASLPGSIQEVDPNTHAVLQTFPTDNEARNPFWHPLRKKLYYAQFTSGEDQIITSNGNLLTTLSLGDWTFASAYVSRYRYVFRTIPNTDQLVALT